MAKLTYRNFFDIDEEYFPTVNEDLINQGKVDWKKFYPHETFVRLISDTISVLTRRQPRSIWVEGAYGTGKSHAVLTLKKLLDASEEEIRSYFEEYGLSKDLMDNMLRIKRDEQQTITVHRYGASNIYSDDDLVFSMQESIRKAMAEKGITYFGENVLKDAVVAWLSDTKNKNYFDALIQEDFVDEFGGDNTDRIIEKLTSFTGDELVLLMNKISKVANKRHITALTLTVDGLIAWIKDVISRNNLKGIVFIWDEFTKYFANNIRDLTGFQKIAELSQTAPFYLIIVTHKSEGIFADNDNDRKILDRFIRPTCLIELPETMAFKLMGAAMRRNAEPSILKEWCDDVDDLFDRTSDSRELVQKSAKITDDELKAILPIHPYTALLLKYLSSAFDSNQRSMFDFIKNDRGDEVKGFQWFIDNYGPEDDNPFLTIDMLWDFFYEKGREQLSGDVRTILDSFSRATTRNLSNDEQRVLKTVLLLQAISHRVGDQVPLFISDEKNLNNAFDGSDLDHGSASGIANKLVRDEVLFRKPMGPNKFQYTAITSAGDTTQIEKFKKELMSKSTSTIVDEGNIGEAISLPTALSLRYTVRYAAEDNFWNVVKLIRNQPGASNKINAVIVFAKDDKESGSVAKLIEQAANDPTFDIVYIDATKSPLGADLYAQYIENMANSFCYRRNDNAMSAQYENMAKETLKKWRSRIAGGEFEVVRRVQGSDADRIERERYVNIDQLIDGLRTINKKKYPYALEANFSVIDNLFSANQLKQGVKCGASGVIEGTYKTNNESMKLENALRGAWGTAVGDRYWEEQPTLAISKIKQCVEDTIAEGFNADAQISISAIYDKLKEAPYGILPCNLTAFVLGFVLREYANDAYRYNDGLTSDYMSIAKLQEMVDDIIKLQNTANPRYKDKYIGTMTDEEKSFNEVTSAAFDIPMTFCTSIQHTRDMIRNKMKELSFPIWCAKYIIDSNPMTTDAAVIREAIDLYTGLANSNNSVTNSSDTDSALRIGRLGQDNPNLKDDLKSLFTKQMCKDGMDKYLHDYQGGMLIELAKEVGDNGQYINELKRKFDADAANWVWNITTANQKINELIEEYSIIVESNKLIVKAVSYKEAISNWKDKCGYLRIAFDAARNHLGDLVDIIALFRDLRRAGILLDSQKKQFLTFLQTRGEDIKEFFSPSYQTSLFRKVCQYYVEQFTNEEVEGVLNTIPVGTTFTLEKTEYNRLVEEKVKDYLNNMGREKLKRIWKENTGTNNPREWSQKYRTPILCLVDEDQVVLARDLFPIFNRTHCENADVEKMLSFLQSSGIYEKMNSAEQRDAAFVRAFLKKYSVILTNIDDVRAYLVDRMSCEVYDWFGSPEVERKITQMAEAKYSTNGCDRALEKIDSMDVSELKRYLKELIKDNMTVGIEIIKGN